MNEKIDHNLVALVWAFAATWHCAVFIEENEWTLTLAEPQW